MEHVYRDGQRQGSMGRAYRDLGRPLQDLTGVLTVPQGRAT